MSLDAPDEYHNEQRYAKSLIKHKIAFHLCRKFMDTITEPKMPAQGAKEMFTRYFQLYSEPPVHVKQYASLATFQERHTYSQGFRMYR